MSQRVFSAAVFIFLLTGMSVLAFNIQPAKAGSGTIYIRADGSIDPLSANIASVDNVTYTFTDDNYDSLVVERDSIAIDGAAYALEGTGSGYGIDLTGRSNVTIENMEIKTFGYGLYLGSSSNDNTISGNNITNNGSGFMLYYSSNNSAVGNMIKSNGYGIASYISWNNFVDNNVITDNNETGIHVAYYPGTIEANWVITNNLVSLNKLGISLEYAGGNLLKNNTIAGNYFSLNVRGQPPEDYFQDIDSSNIVDGKPIYYWINQHSEIVPVDAGYVAVLDSTNITVRDFDLTRNGPGVLFVNVSHSTIENVNFSNYVNDGMYLWNCSDITIRQDRIDGTIGGVGISLIGSSNNTINSNILTHNYEGILVYYGLDYPYVYPADRNTITENAIMNNDRGISLYMSSNDVIYHNNFINNTNQVWFYSDGTTNVWDNGYPSGGNYWSDYNGTDLVNGLYQNKTGSDGIGDTSYVIDQNSIDRYPLIQAYVSFLGDLNHDRTVDISDAILVASAFGTYPGHPNWNSQADLNNDNTIDIFDLIILASNFGKH